MNPEKMTTMLREAIEAARQICISKSQQQLSPAHLLLALIEQENGIVAQVFTSLGKNVGAIRSDLQSTVDGEPKVRGTSASDIYMSPNAQKALDEAQKQMKGLVLAGRTYPHSSAASNPKSAFIRGHFCAGP